MFTMTIEPDLDLALVKPEFAKSYLEIVLKDRDYLSQWLAWPLHAHDEVFDTLSLSSHFSKAPFSAVKVVGFSKYPSINWRIIARSFSPDSPDNAIIGVRGESCLIFLLASKPFITGI